MKFIGDLNRKGLVGNPVLEEVQKTRACEEVETEDGPKLFQVSPLR